MADLMSKALVELTKYGYQYHLFIHKDLEKYNRQEKLGKKQMLWLGFRRLLLIVAILRFLLTIKFENNEMIRIITADCTFQMANRNIFNSLMSIELFSGLCMLISLQYFEMKSNSPGIRLVYSASKKSLPFKLIPSDEKRLALVTHLLTKFMVRQGYGVLMAVNSAGYLYFTYVTYFDPESGLTLFWIIFWCVVNYIAFQQIFGMLSAGMTTVSGTRVGFGGGVTKFF